MRHPKAAASDRCQRPAAERAQATVDFSKGRAIRQVLRNCSGIQLVPGQGAALEIGDLLRAMVKKVVARKRSRRLPPAARCERLFELGGYGHTEQALLYGIQDFRVAGRLWAIRDVLRNFFAQEDRPFAD